MIRYVSTLHTHQDDVDVRLLNIPRKLAQPSSEIEAVHRGKYAAAAAAAVDGTCVRALCELLDGSCEIMSPDVVCEDLRKRGV